MYINERTRSSSRWFFLKLNFIYFMKSLIYYEILIFLDQGQE